MNFKLLQNEIQKKYEGKLSLSKVTLSFVCCSTIKKQIFPKAGANGLKTGKKEFGLKRPLYVQ